jgi:hypothetical protein
MASLLSLSTELKLMIIENLDLTSTSFISGPSQDLLSISRVCKVLRLLSLSHLFKDITLLNNQKSGSSVLAILQGTYAEHVRNLHYIGIMAVPESSDVSDEPVKEPSPDDLPESVEQVLSGLTKLPNLEQVTVQFACADTADDDEEIYRNSYEIFEELETDEEVQESENTIAFRSLMERSYRALSRNPASGIKHLELKDVMPKKCSAWNLADFQALLGGLSSFTISLRGGDNGAGWQINKVQGYLDFVAELHLYFFKHLSNVKHFSFAATDDGPPGIEDGMSNTAFPLLEQHMPKLESLLLERVFISQTLADFITAHGEKLASVQLNHCYSAWDEEGAICWGDFLSSIFEKNMKSLKTFTISPSYFEELQDTDEKSYDHKLAVQVQQLREQYPGRRMFDYKTLDDKYGMVFDNEEQAIEKFEDGRDQSSWEQLCKLVKDNGEHHS